MTKERKNQKGSVSASASSGSTITTSSISLFWYVLLAAIASCLVIWSLLYRYDHPEDKLISHHSRYVRNNIKSSGNQDQYEQVKKLFDEAKQLLHEISQTNITISSHTKEEIDTLQSEHKLIEKEIESLQRERNHIQNNFAQCVLEKYKISEDLEKCERKIDHLSEQHDPVPDENDFHLEEELDKHDYDLRSFLRLDKNPRSYRVNEREIDEPDNFHDIDARKAQITSVASETKATTKTEEKWLVVGIPTLARPNNEDYLLRSLATIAAQLPSNPDSVLYHKILIAVIHVQPSSSSSTHMRFTEAKKLYSNNPYFLFDELLPTEVYPDPRKGATPENDYGSANIPGYRVRKQSRNLAAVVNKVAALGRYYLFLEDDMEFCPYGVLAIQYMIEKSTRYHPNWLAIRASYGMNGIVMKGSDALVFADYLIRNQERRPPDHLVVEWYAGESKESSKYRGTRANIGYRYNLFNHIGYVSTLRSAKQTAFPVCYDMLVEPTVFQVEAFNPHQCPRDDIWPCQISHPEPTYIHWDQVAIGNH